MKRPDPTYFAPGQPKTKIIYAYLQSQGDRETQEDCFANFNDECFVVADGVGGMPHGEVAAGLAVDTAIWGYKQIRLRETYWSEKKLFLNRIFRSVNIAVWQKHRESGFEDGMASTLLVLVTSVRNFFVGNAGDSSSFLYRAGEIKKLTVADSDNSGKLTKVIGVERFGLVPQIYVDRFEEDDVILLATDGITEFISENDLKKILADTGYTDQDLQKSVKLILSTAQGNGSTDNMTACIVKRIKS